MDPRSKVDPWSDFSLSAGGLHERKSSDSSVKRPGDIPFYVSQYKTSAEIIEEAKATMTRGQGAFPSIG